MGGPETPDLRLLREPLEAPGTVSGADEAFPDLTFLQVASLARNWPSSSPEPDLVLKRQAVRLCPVGAA